jgi:hypothetical protein
VKKNIKKLMCLINLFEEVFIKKITCCFIIKKFDECIVLHGIFGNCV